MMDVVKNWKVFGLEDSVRASKYPMAVNVDEIIPSEKLSFWLLDDFLPRFLDHMSSGKYPKYEVCDDFVRMTVQHKNGDEESVVFDEEDLPSIFAHDWHIERYCCSNDVGLMHRYVLNEYLQGNEDVVIDHINRDRLDNRKSNLRISTKSENGYNSKLRGNNKSGVLGVSWRSDRGKWRAYINRYYKQESIGMYDTYEEAVKARLIRERDVCGEFAPQKHLFEQYGITALEKPNIERQTAKLKDAISAYKLATRLANAERGSGHDNWLNGIIVQFDLTFSIKAWVEAERYHFLDFVSSQSTMHRIERLDPLMQCNEYVDVGAIAVLQRLLDAYKADPTADNRLRLLYNVPVGFRLTARMTTNYRQLKTIYSQRRTHRLPEWREFCKWLEELPHSEFITGGDKNVGTQEANTAISERHLLTKELRRDEQCFRLSPLLP